MDATRALTRRTIIRARELTSGRQHAYRVASTCTHDILWETTAPASCVARRAITIAPSPLGILNKPTASKRFPFVSVSQLPFTRMSNLSSNAASDAAADAALRAMAMAEPLDGLKEALANEDLVPVAPWGLAVFRTAYGNDTAWHRMLDALEAAAAESLALCGQSDLLERHQLVRIEDRAALDGAGLRDVRERFTRWAAEELRRNWQSAETAPNEEHARATDSDSPGYFSGTLYNYCLQVDDICLKSLEHMASSVVKLVRKAWEGGQEEDAVAAAEINQDGQGVENGDVGWMYLPVRDYVECYSQLHDVEFWDDGYYVSPPFTFLDRTRAYAPGFWRRQGNNA